MLLRAKGVAKSKTVRLLVLIAVAVGGALNAAPTARAESVDIGVSVCAGSVAAQLTVTQPINDSVVDQPNVTLRGTVANATQVEIRIDNQYVSAVSIGPSDSTYEFALSMPVGTHTITATALALCGGQNASGSTIVTYTPAATVPSSGGTTPTSIEGQTVTGDPDALTPVNENDMVKQIEQLPIIGPVVSVVGDFASAIGLESTVVGSGSAPPVAGVARVGVTVAALTSVVMASSLAPVAVQAVPGVSEIFNATSHRSMMYLGWVIRGAGILAMAFAYFI